MSQYCRNNDNGSNGDNRKGLKNAKNSQKISEKPQKFNFVLRIFVLKIDF